MAFDWTAEAVATLRRIAAEGGSFSEAAEALGVTRSAIAGKANREGIPFDCSPTRHRTHTAAGMRAYWSARSRTGRQREARA
jgi:hypothetical protein